MADLEAVGMEIADDTGGLVSGQACRVFYGRECCTLCRIKRTDEAMARPTGRVCRVCRDVGVNSIFCQICLSLVGSVCMYPPLIL